MSVRFFGPGEYPYQTRLLGRTAESVAYDLKANGYATHAIHNHQATFYKRNEVYPNLGFDYFIFLEYMPKTAETPKNWAKDAVLTGQITQGAWTPPPTKRTWCSPSPSRATANIHGAGADEPGPLRWRRSQTRPIGMLEYYVNQIFGRWIPLLGS